MTRKLKPGLAILVILMLCGIRAEAGGGTFQRIFTAKTAEGEVWVSADLALQRRTDAFVPLVVAVYNSAKTSAVIERSSLKLIGTDGVPIRMAGIPELRKSYSKQNFDVTMLRLYGMPFGTWLRLQRLVPSNFFPIVSVDRGGVRIERVELAPFFWTIDLVYFKRPVGLAEGRTVILEVAPKGWQTPIQVKLHL